MKPASILPALFLPLLSTIGAAQCDSELQKLLADPPDGGSLFGRAVATSGDALFVGEPRASASIGSAGRVHVYTRGADVWEYAASLEPGDGQVGGEFGWSLAALGDTLVVGSPWARHGWGAVYVFERDGESWRRTTRLDGDPDMSGFANFGVSVSIHEDTIAVGAWADDFIGSVSAFVRHGTDWILEAKLWNPDPTFLGTLGGKVAVYGDTLLAATFAPSTIYAWERGGGVWSRISFPAGTRGNASLALEGERLVVGDPAPYPEADPGSARVYTRSGTSWSEEALDSPDGTPGDRYGAAVSIAGERVVVGAPGSAAGRGAVYVFEEDGGTWIQTARFVASDALGGDELGGSVAQSDGIVVAGAEGDRDAGADTGAAYVFDATEPGTPYCEASASSLGEPAVLRARGCSSLEAGGLAFEAAPVPDEPGVFVYGPARVERPFGDGRLCAGGTLTRSPVQVGHSGLLWWTLELAVPPHDQISAGSTWFFQAWFRDPAAGGSGFNLSSALEIAFRP